MTRGAEEDRLARGRVISALRAYWSWADLVEIRYTIPATLYEPARRSTHRPKPTEAKAIILALLDPLARMGAYIASVLTEQELSALWLRYNEGLSVRMTARVLEMSKTSFWRLQERAIARAIKVLDEWDNFG